MTPDPITTAREALNQLAKTAGFLFNTDVSAKYTADVTAGLDYAERLQTEADPDALVIAHMHGAQMATEKHREEIAKLKAERDEALCRLLSTGSEKPTAEDMDWAISLSASLRREEITVEDNEITRLTSQLDQAEKVVKPFAEVVKSMHAGMSYHSTIVPAKHYFAASQWIKDRQAKGEG